MVSTGILKYVVASRVPEISLKISELKFKRR